MKPYTYAVLRYVHDTLSREFLNVGVIVFAPEAKFLGHQFRKSYARLARTFPGIDGEAFRILIRGLENQLTVQATRAVAELPLGNWNDAVAYAQSVLPKDDSSLQWSPLGSGVTDDPQRTLDELFERMVVRYEERQQNRRTDDE